MVKFANQNSIIVSKNETKIPFAAINEDALQYAMNDLKNDAFKMWIYFMKNQNGYEFALSQKACESWGIKKDGYYRAKDQLVERGYLVDQGNSRFEFREIPKEISDESCEERQGEEKKVVSVFDF